jgi:hypothetical protein
VSVPTHLVPFSAARFPARSVRGGRANRLLLQNRATRRRACATKSHDMRKRWQASDRIASLADVPDARFARLRVRAGRRGPKFHIRRVSPSRDSEPLMAAAARESLLPHQIICERHAQTMDKFRDFCSRSDRERFVVASRNDRPVGIIHFHESHLEWFAATPGARWPGLLPSAVRVLCKMLMKMGAAEVTAQPQVTWAAKALRKVGFRSDDGGWVYGRRSAAPRMPAAVFCFVAGEDAGAGCEYPDLGVLLDDS